MKHRAVVHDGIVELFDFGLTPARAFVENDFPLLGLAVNAKPVRRLANITLLATDHRETEKRLFSGAAPDVTVFAFAFAAEAHAFFELFFFLGSAHFAQLFSDVEIGFRRSMLSAFADPTKKLRGIEEPVTAIDQRRRRAVLKLEITGVAALPFTRLVPDAGHGAHTADHAAADQAHDIDVVRSLIEHYAATHGQFVSHARTVHELVVVPSMDHAELAELAALDNFSDLSDRRIEAMRVAAQQLHAIFFRRFVHSVALRDRRRHRLFDDHVLAAFGGRDHMLGVQRVWRGDVNRVDVGAFAHRFDAYECFTAVSLAKFGQRVGARVRGGGNLDIGQCGDRRHDLRARHAEAGYA